MSIHSLLRKSGKFLHLLKTGNILSSNEKLNINQIKDNIKTAFIAGEIVYFDKIDSTNREAKDLADKGAKEGTLVITEEQTKGRGRLNRSWISEPYRNILMSIIFRPDLPPSKLFSLTMISSIALVRAIRKATGLKVMIKWPNDIYYDNKKLAGILTELKADRSTVNYAIVGTGLNVNSDPSNDPGIGQKATSLCKETGHFISRNALLCRILKETERQYNLLKKGKLEKIRKEWNRYSLVFGRHVIIYSGNYTEEGKAVSITHDGALIIIKDNGEQKNILCGDVSLRLK